MADMKKYIINELKNLKAVQLTLINGKEIVGVLETQDQDSVCLKTQDGRSKSIRYELIGMVDPVEAPENLHASSNNPMRDEENRSGRDSNDVQVQINQAVEAFKASSVDFLHLKTILENSYPEYRAEYAGALDSLINAIKIRETNIKFDRIPRVVTSFQESLRRHPENAHLALMIVESALLTGDQKFCRKTLQFLGGNWEKAYRRTPGFLKELCDLCITGKDSTSLRQIFEMEKLEKPDELCTALFYLLCKTKSPFQLSEGVPPFSTECVDVLLKALPFHQSERAASPSQTAKQPVPSAAPTAKKTTTSVLLKGEIKTYDSNMRNGFLVGEDGREYFFRSSALSRALDGKLCAHQKVQFKCQTSFDPQTGASRDPIYDIQPLNSASNEGSSSQQLLRKANDLYTKGKVYDSEALKIFHTLLARNYINISVASTYVPILCRNDRSAEAEQFLLRNEKTLRSRDKDKYLMLLLNAYEKQGNPQKLLNIYTEILSSSNPSMRVNTQLHYINRKAALLIRQNQPKEALTDLERWLTLKKENEVALRAQTLGFDTLEPRICVMAVAQIKRIQKSEPEFAPSPTILSFINRHPEAAQAMEEQAATVLDRDSMSDDVYGIRQIDMQITPLVDKLLKECNITQYLDVRVYDRSTLTYNRNIPDAIQEAKQQGQSTTQRPYERYLRNLTAARVIYDALRRDWTGGGGPILEDVRDDAEKLFFNSIGRSLVSGGDNAVLNSEAPLDMARYYYEEGLQYLPRDSQDAQNAVVRVITSFLPDRSQIPMAMNSDRNISISEEGANAISKIPDEKIEGLLLELIEMTERWPDLNKTILKILFNSMHRNKIVDVLCRNICNMAECEDCGDQAALQKVFEQAQTAIKSRAERFAKGIAKLNDFSYRPKWIDDFSTDLSWYSNFKRSMPEEDQARIDMVINDFLRAARQYNSVTDFSLKEEALRGNYDSAKQLKEAIDQKPTRCAFRYLYPLLDIIIEKTKDELNIHYGGAAPCVDLEIVGMDSLTVSDKGHLSIQVNIKNTGNCQVADNLTLEIQNAPDEYEVVSQDERYVAVKGNDGVTFQVELKLKSPENRAFTLRYKIGYQYTKAVGLVSPETSEQALAVIINGGTFKGLENPYSLYVSAATVDREDMVFGRKQFIDDIVTTCIGSNGNPLRRKTISLYGQKRTGKSTVLYHLNRKLKERSHHSIVINLGDISKWNAENFEKQMFHKFFEELRNELETRHPDLKRMLQEAGIRIPRRNEITSNEIGREFFGDFFTDFNRLINASPAFRDYNVIMLLDEFTNIYIRLCNNRENLRGPKMDDDFMLYWKAIVNDFGLVCIVVGQDFMKDFVNAYPNPFGAVDYQQVTYLPDDEARRMIVAPPVEDRDKRIIFEGPPGERAIKRIIELTAGSAFFLMIFMDRLIKYLIEREQQYVTDADVDRVTRDSLLSGSDGLDLQKFESLYNDDGDVKDPSRPRHNAAILWAISHCLHKFRRCTVRDIDIPDGLDDKAALNEKRCGMLISKLADRGVLSRTSDGNDTYYTIRVKLFDEWLYSSCSIETINSIPDFSRKE
mgnify:CR=1 FL=1